MALIRKIQYLGELDSGNSSVVPLGAGEVFTGEKISVLDFGIVYISIATDVASDTDGLSIEQSSNGVNWDHNDVYAIPANATKNYSINPHSQFLRVVYTNGSVAQGHFRLETILKPSGKPSSHRIQDSIVDEDDAELVKSVLTGQSEINSAFENVMTYRGALQVDDSLVHRIGISEHTKRGLDGSTTLDVAASAGDTLINVASTANFTTSSLVTINGTTGERSHFHVNAIDDGVSLTLDRPLDNDHDVGSAILEIDIGMNVAGSLGSPISFKVQPPSFERWQLTRILTTLLDQTAMDDNLFGGITALSNGVVLRINKDGQDRTLTHWKTNADLKDDMYDVEYSTRAPSGFFGMSARWTFTKAEFVVDLDGATGDYLEVLIQDDLTDLDDFEIKAQGRLFGG